MRYMETQMKEVVTPITTMSQLETKFDTLVNAPGLVGTVYQSSVEPVETAEAAGKPRLNVFREELDYNNRPISREHHILEYICKDNTEVRKVDIKMRHMEKVSEHIIREKEAVKRKEEADKKTDGDNKRANKQTWLIALIGFLITVTLGLVSYYSSKSSTKGITEMLKANHVDLIEYIKAED